MLLMLHSVIEFKLAHIYIYIYITFVLDHWLLLRLQHVHVVLLQDVFIVQVIRAALSLPQWGVESSSSSLIALRNPLSTSIESQSMLVLFTPDHDHSAMPCETCKVTAPQAAEL